MKTWIGAMTLMALLAIGDAARPVSPRGESDHRSATKPNSCPRARSASSAQDRAGYGPYDRGMTAVTYYYGRPYFYAPAPFPLGFDSDSAGGRAAGIA